MSYSDPGQAWWNYYVTLSPSAVADLWNIDPVFKENLLSVQHLSLYGFADKSGSVAGSNQVSGNSRCNMWK